MNTFAVVQDARKPQRGRNTLAQGNALGSEGRRNAALKGRDNRRLQRQKTDGVKGVSLGFSGSPAIGMIFLLCAAAPPASFGESPQLEMNLAGELQTHREIAAFSGSSIEVVFQFIAADPAGHLFAADLYQKSTSLAAPVFKDLPPVTAVQKAGSVVGEVAFVVDLPAVERQTAFLLRMKARPVDRDDWQVEGKITIVAHPPLDWVALCQRIKGTQIRSKGDGDVGDFLADVGFAVVTNATGDSPKSQGIVLWESGAVADEVARIELRADGAETVQHVFLPPLESLATEAHSQIILYRMMEAAIRQYNPSLAFE